MIEKIRQITNKQYSIILKILFFSYLYLNSIFTYEYYNYFEVNYFLIANPTQIIGMLMFAAISITGKINIIILIVIYIMLIGMIVFSIQNIKFLKFAKLKKALLQLFVVLGLFILVWVMLYFFFNPENLSFFQILHSNQVNPVINDYPYYKLPVTIIVLSSLIIILGLFGQENKIVERIILISLSLSLFIAINFITIRSSQIYAQSVANNFNYSIKYDKYDSWIDCSIIGKVGNLYLINDIENTRYLIPENEISSIKTTHNNVDNDHTR